MSTHAWYKTGEGYLLFRAEGHPLHKPHPIPTRSEQVKEVGPKGKPVSLPVGSSTEQLLQKQKALFGTAKADKLLPVLRPVGIANYDGRKGEWLYRLDE